MQSLLILGRQPELGLAELESLYGPGEVRAAGSQAALVDVDPCLLTFNRLGGSQKFCKVLTTLDDTDWSKIEKFLLSAAPAHAQSMPDGKMHLGLSAYDFKETTQRIQATALKLKKAIRSADPNRSVRVVPNKESALNTAQVIHNNLTTPNGWELVFIKDGQQTIVAQTVKVQDIAAYGARDQGRPARDSRVGMLPPKLAQIIINLAAGPLPESAQQNICDIPAGDPIPPTILNQTVLDPFCGTGVLLQEALLMGYAAYGTDIEKRMIDYSRRNLDWLTDKYQLTDSSVQLEQGDATNHTWSPAPNLVAAEGYLGKPFTTAPPRDVLAQTMNECNVIIRKTLQNLAKQLPSGTRLCLAVPAWHMGSKIMHLPLIDHLPELGYNTVDFEATKGLHLTYHRPDQIVARELLVIIRK